MGLESGEFLADLDQANPITATDPVSEGSNHLRLLKKVLQQTFPNYTEAVTLSAAELNDAALKAADNAFLGANTFAGITSFAAQTDFNANTLFANNVQTRWRNAADTAELFGIYVNGSDALIIGDLSIDTIMRSATQIDFRSGGGSLTSARVVDRASGSLLSWDVSGSPYEVLRTGGDVQTIATPHEHSSNIRLRNDVALQSRNAADDAWHDLLNLSASDFLVVGDQFATMRITSDQFIEMRINNSNQAKFVGRTDGTLLLQDRNNNEKKAGFRNPERETITVNSTNAQDWENRILTCNVAGLELTIDSLEAFTCYMILVTGGDVTLKKGAGTSTFQIQDGFGGTPSGTNATLVAGAVVQVWHLSPSVVRLWGTGITPA